MTSPDLAAAAIAYRTERERYWIRRRRVGETVTPGGVSALIVTDVQTVDETVVFTGGEEEAKAWLDLTCLKAALGRMLANPSDTLVSAAGGPTVLRAVAECMLSEG